jgi:hypothetical protein
MQKVCKKSFEDLQEKYFSCGVRKKSFEDSKAIFRVAYVKNHLRIRKQNNFHILNGNPDDSNTRHNIVYNRVYLFF